MKRILSAAILTTLTAVGVLSGQSQAVTVFENARVIVGAGRPPIERGVLVVQNGRVTAAGDRGSVNPPANAARVDLTGKTVMPAIVNGHIHLGFQRGPLFAAESYTRENIVDQLNRYAVAGVAAVVSLGTDAGPIPDAIRADQRSGKLGGALFRMAGRGIAPPDAGPANAAMRPSAYGVRTEEEARAAVREQAARGVDVIKIWVDDRNGTVPKLSPELARAVIDEAHKHKLKAIAHIFYLDDAKWLARAGVNGFAHLMRDREADDELVTLMRDHGVVIIPNMAINQNGVYTAPPDWLDDPLFRAVTTTEDADRIRASFNGRTAQSVERAAATFRGMERSVARMKAGGVKFAFGTDAGAVRDHVHAFTDHRELEIMVRAGLTPMEAIAAATSGSAELAGLTDLGALTPGKSADFIVLDANPLDDIRNTRRIARVYLRGVEVDRGAIISAQSAAGTKASHREAARAAAGQDHVALFNRICVDPAGAAAPAAPAARGTAPPANGPRQAPPRERWYAEPVKVFDNLYFVGTREHGAWAVVGSEGIIVIDALYEYAVEDEVVGGLKKLGIDPAQIKYLIISHGHGDHHGGAKLLQERFGARVVMGADDWALVEKDARTPRPKRDIVATDGMEIRVGDQKVTLYLTPGHTLGTISTLVPVKDGGRNHLAAAWGGTSFSAATPREQVNLYVDSAVRFRDIAAKAGADVLIGNHTAYDGNIAKTAALAKRRPGDPNPYVIGKDAVSRYLTVAEECARVELAGS